MIYIVTKEGVYRHEILYAGEDRTFAMVAAESAIKSEHDDYHEFAVLALSDGAAETIDSEVGRYKRKDKCHYEPREGATSKYDCKRVIDSTEVEWVDAQSAA